MQLLPCKTVGLSRRYHSSTARLSSPGPLKTAVIQHRGIKSQLRQPTSFAADQPCTARFQQQHDAQRGQRQVQYASTTAGGGAATDARPPAAAWKVPIYILLWYAFNIIFNILNKSSLNAFPCPWFISASQLIASGLFMVGLWVTRLQPTPKVDRQFLVALLPVALFHTIGHVSACVSFSHVSEPS
eukprot:GHRR01012096.1.p1 GENE.GHRR01012096.1~~GHRR01012096.1.p1  ORF type:complete len:186 (+),score=35.20 GHRR01012096.1:200-757(+)